jgi:pyruvate dehydrogenase E2 component (dihydrolipoamide acetyltransferase)
MPANVIMPALELAQETGKVLKWLKRPGDRVAKGEPLVEIETDKVTTEIESPAAGVLREVTAAEGDVVPVGRTIAVIADEVGSTAAAAATAAGGDRALAGAAAAGTGTAPVPSAGRTGAEIKASPLARRIAEQHGVDLAQVRTASGRIEKADVLAHVETRAAAGADGRAAARGGPPVRLAAASPKARRLAGQRGLDLDTLRGSGPEGAVLAVDVLAAPARAPERPAARPAVPEAPAMSPAAAAEAPPAVGTVWRIMAERMTASWTSAPHFYLVREVNVGRLVAWLEHARTHTGARVTYTDLLVKLVAAALTRHPRVNVSWKDGAIVQHADVNVGLAVAIDDGLVVPVIHRADALGLAEIAARREDVVSRAQGGKLRPADIQGGVFTISNLGMFGVDAFNAIVNPPQAAILAVGRIADRVVAVGGLPVVQPTMVLTLSCDHRALDGARGARFLGALADLVEEPLALLT